jgi:hypothetical protein
VGEAGTMSVCPRGHEVGPFAKFCAKHGSPVFQNCSCGARWPTVRVGYFGSGPAHFCTQCGQPGPWVSRRERVLWLKDRLDADLDEATALELRELLDRLERDISSSQTQLLAVVLNEPDWRR